MRADAKRRLLALAFRIAAVRAEVAAFLAGEAGLAAFGIMALEPRISPTVITALSLLMAAGLVTIFVVMTNPRR